MKNLYLSLAVCAIVCINYSCSAYQFATLQSNLEQPFSDGFIFENDTIQLHYDFNGLNCPLNLSVYNKTSEPIHINWDQSSLIINGETLPLNPQTAVFNTEYSESSVEHDYISYTDGVSSGSIVNNDRTGFIPPQAVLRLNSINVCTGFLNTNLGTTENSRTLVESNGQSYTVKASDFTKENSPLYFRCFISYSGNKKDNWHFIDSDFWVTSIYQTTDTQLPRKANRFYLSKSTGVGEVVGLAALTGLAIIAIDNNDFGDEEL